jgi:hypothetical protein
MKLTPEQIQAKLDSFNKEYKESGWTDGKILSIARYEAVRQNSKDPEFLKRSFLSPEAKVRAGIESKKTRVQRFGHAAGQMHTIEAQTRAANNHKKAILQCDKQGNFIKEWLSGNEASTKLGICRGTISSCLKGKIKSAGGFIWKYKNEQ